MTFSWSAVSCQNSGRLSSRYSPRAEITSHICDQQGISNEYIFCKKEVDADSIYKVMTAASAFMHSEKNCVITTSSICMKNSTHFLVVQNPFYNCFTSLKCNLLQIISRAPLQPFLFLSPPVADCQTKQGLGVSMIHGTRTVPTAKFYHSHWHCVCLDQLGLSHITPTHSQSQQYMPGTLPSKQYRQECTRFVSPHFTQCFNIISNNLQILNSLMLHTLQHVTSFCDMITQLCWAAIQIFTLFHKFRREKKFAITKPELPCGWFLFFFLSALTLPQ